MERKNKIPGTIIALRIEVAKRFGVDAAIALQEADLLEEELTDPTAKISMEKGLALWQSFIRQTGLQSIGLECGMEARFQTMGILGYVMVNSPTILKALEKLCIYQQCVLPLLRLELIVEGESVKIMGTLQEDWQDGFQYSIDYIMSSCYSMINKGNLHQIKPLELGLTFPEPPYANRYSEVFEDALIRFSCQHTYISFKKSDLETPVTLANADLYTHFETLLHELIESEDTSKQYTRSTKQLIQKRVKASIPTINEVARDQALSTRTLQDYLKKEGTSFREIIKTVRMEHQ